MGSGGGIRIGTVGGVPIRIASSWFVIAAIITFLYSGLVANYTGPGLPAYLGAFGFALLLAASVLAHEAAHAIAARGFGLTVDEIVVDLWGGHTSLGAPRSPLQAAVVSVVAPLVNIAIAGLMYAVSQGANPTGLVGFLIDAVMVANLLVGAFNLLPGLPLDGGRVAEAIVWGATGDRDRGTQIAGWGGRVVVVAAAFFVLVLPLLQGRSPNLVSVIWVALLGATLWRAASAAIDVSAARRRIRAVDMTGLTAPARGVPADVSVAQWLAVAVPHATGILVAPDGRPVAVVDPAALAAVPSLVAPTTPLTAVSARIGEGAWAAPGAGALELAELLARVGGPGVVLVGGQPGAAPGPVGWVSREALARAAAVSPKGAA